MKKLLVTFLVLTLILVVGVSAGFAGDADEKTLPPDVTGLDGLCFLVETDPDLVTDDVYWAVYGDAWGFLKCVFTLDEPAAPGTFDVPLCNTPAGLTDNAFYRIHDDGVTVSLICKVDI